MDNQTLIRPNNKNFITIYSTKIESDFKVEYDEKKIGNYFHI